MAPAVHWWLMHIILTAAFLPANLSGWEMAAAGGAAQKYIDHSMPLIDIRSDDTQWAESLCEATVERRDNLHLKMNRFSFVISYQHCSDALIIPQELVEVY